MGGDIVITKFRINRNIVECKVRYSAIELVAILY